MPPKAERDWRLYADDIIEAAGRSAALWRG